MTTTTRNANDHFGSHNGSENIYACRPFPVTYTDGVRDMIQNCKAYWLIDLIMSYQTYKNVNQENFQVWELKRIEYDCFMVYASDGNNAILTSQEIPYSDFPFDMATIWLVNDTLLLPNEY